MERIRRISFALLKLARTSQFQKDIIDRRWKTSILDCNMSIRILSCGYTNYTALQNSAESVNDELFKDPKIASLLDIIIREKIKPEDLLNAVKCSPEILDKPSSLWEKCFAELKYHGFKSRHSFKMLTEYPQLFTLIDQNELKMIMMHWTNCQLGYDNMLDLLVACPHFLSVPSQELARRIPLLQSLSKSRGKGVARLLQSCPALMYENRKLIEAKLDYVENVMKIDTKNENLTKCYMFNRSLDEIKTRHAFLLRAGIYVTPKQIKGKKAELQQQPWSKNPRLNQITDTNDAKFISEIAPNMTVEELEVFREMYKEELEQESDDEDGDESEGYDSDSY